MVHSMTAFARCEQAGPFGTLCWELRSVNHRYLEPHLRLPESFRELEITGGDRDLTEKEEAQIIEEQNALTALCEKEAAKCSS